MVIRGALLVVASWTIAATAVYYLWQWNLFAIVALLALGAVAGFFAWGAAGRDWISTPARRPVRRSASEGGSFSVGGGDPISKLGTSKLELLVALIGLTSLVLAAVILFNSGTVEAIRTPWEVVSPRFLPLLGLAVFAAVTLGTKLTERRLAAILAAFTLGLGLFAGAAIYKIGYGFDPFIHEAAMREIAANGAVLPKTPYYIGAYVDLVSFSRLTALPLHEVNRFAGPAVGWLALVSAALLTTSLPLAILLAAFGPLADFIATTPQGIANALALLAAVFAFRAIQQKERWLLPLAAALAALAVHPLAGVPALLLLALAYSRARVKNPRLRRGFVTTCLAALLIFPTAAFFSQSRLAPALSLQGGRERLTQLAQTVFPAPTLRTFSPGRTLIYSARTYLPLIVLLLALLFALRKKQGERRLAGVFIAGALATAAGGFLLAAAVKLPGIIGYEQAIFPVRFVGLAGIFLFPLALSGAILIAEKFLRTPYRRLALALALSLAVPAAVYLAYPRVDPEEKTGNRSVSAATVEAVDFLHTRASGSYVVLANQTAAAAEIWRYGFSRYVKDEFYYSHPSGSLKLYGYYLEATYNGPTRELMQKVLDDYGVDTVYLMLHDYWKRFPQLDAEAQKTADSFWSIASGKVMIFEYRR